MIIELHMLQNFAPSCLNRDDTGAPKECEFGGYRRARISSQCIKRAIRDYFRRHGLFSEDDLAVRTKLLVRRVAEKLQDKGRDHDVALKLVQQVASALIKMDKASTSYLLFVGNREIDRLAELIHQHWEKLSQPDVEGLPAGLKKALLDTLDGGKAVDLALFGRMIADLPEKNIDAACQVAHAISTNKVSIEFDYFTAIDDLQPEAETGAGMLGTIEFSSACYYRYANIDLGQLKKNLQGDDQLTSEAWKAFIKAAVNAVPTGRQNSMSAQNPPDFVFAVARKHGAWSLANAFLKPISPTRDNDVLQRSAIALVDYWKKLVTAYGDSGVTATPVLSLLDVPLDGLQRVANMDGLLKTLDSALGCA